MGKDSLSDSMERTINFSDLEEISTDLAEVFLDQVIDDSVLRDIPIVGLVVGLSKTAKFIKELLFLKKIVNFLKEPGKISPNERMIAIDKINSSKKYRTRVGEKLVDKCDDSERAELFGLFFAHFLRGKISYEDFLRLSKATDNLILEDVLEFAISDWKSKDIDSAAHLVNSGLVEIGSPEITVEDQWDHEMSNKYSVEGSNLKVYVTRIGELLREILKKDAKRF